MRQLLIAVLLFGSIQSATAAGPLEPPGAPEPTMKTLHEVEPRTAITNDSLPLTIKEPGSYYLAEDIVYANEGHAIEIGTNQLVTIDLNGFSLRGDPKMLEIQTSAIYSQDPGSVSISNGFIGGFGGRTIDLLSSSVDIDRLTIEHGIEGLRLGAQSSLTNSVVRSPETKLPLDSGRIIWMTHGALVESCSFSFDDRGSDVGSLVFLRTTNAAIIRNNSFSNMNFNATSLATVIQTDDACVIANNTIANVFRFKEGIGGLTAIDAQHNSVIQGSNLSFIWSTGDLAGIVTAGSAHVFENQLRTLRGNTLATVGIASQGIIDRNIIGFFEILGQDGESFDIPAAIRASGTITNNFITGFNSVIPETPAILVQGTGSLVRENTISSLQGNTIGIYIPSTKARAISNSVTGGTTSMKITGDKNYYASNVLDSAPVVTGTGNIAGTGSNLNVIIP